MINGVFEKHFVILDENKGFSVLIIERVKIKEKGTPFAVA